MAKKEEVESSGEEGEEKSGGKGKLIIIIVALLVLIGGGAGAFMFMSGDDDAGEEGEVAEVVEEVVVPDVPIYLAMDRFLVNFDYKGGIRYVQADLQIMGFSQATIDDAQLNMPAVRNRLIMLFSEQDFEALRKVEGKEALRKDILAAVNESLGVSGPEAIQDVFFTSFVLQ